MSYIEKRNEIRPATGEAPFSIDEVFFSRTDERGVIAAGNYVFRRVANYDWPDMLGAPHKLIRHPDMPKGVFWLFWNHLKQGKPIGAYVKNRARDGLYYWVFAVAAPIAGGYLSARIKPSSKLLTKIEAEYAALLTAEKTEGLSPEDSASRLLARLGTMGFENYDRFAAHALSEELLSRDGLMNQTLDPKVSAYRQMTEAATALTAETVGLVDEFQAMRTIPHNMRVIASRLEPTGGPVSTLSKNYGAISQEMSDWFAHHVVGDNSNFAAILGSVNRSMFLESTARILNECNVQLNDERRKLGDIDMEMERGILIGQVKTYHQYSVEGLARVREEAERILRACDTMNRHVLGLSSTRVLCKIESGRTQGAAEGLADIITQLGTFQERISARLERIAYHSRKILDLKP